MPGRQYHSGGYYRYGFNGKENDLETTSSSGGTQDYGFRIYNPALGRFLSVDPLTDDYPELTPYQFASNSPIENVDLDGLEKMSINEHLDKYTPVLAPITYGWDWLTSGMQDWFHAQMSQADNEFDHSTEGGGYAEYVPESVQEINYKMRSVENYTKAANGLIETYEKASMVQGVVTTGATMVPVSNVGNNPAKVAPTQVTNKQQAAANNNVNTNGVKEVVVTSTKSNPIKGYTKHGLNQAISRGNSGSYNVGVKPSAILDAAINPKKIITSRDNTSVYVGKKAKIVFNKDMKIVTVSGSSRGKSSAPTIAPRKTGGGKAQARTQKATGTSYNPNLIR